MIALGHGLGDDGRSMVSLHPEVLQAAAIATTGLDDFGDDWWEEPFRRLCAPSIPRRASTCPAASAPGASSSSFCRTACAWSTSGTKEPGRPDASRSTPPSS